MALNSSKIYNHIKHTTFSYGFSNKSIVVVPDSGYTLSPKNLTCTLDTGDTFTFQSLGNNAVIYLGGSANFANSATLTGSVDIPKKYTGSINKPENTSYSINNMNVIIKPDENYTINNLTATIQAYMGGATESIKAITKNNNGSYTITIPDDYANDSSPALFIRADVEAKENKYIGNITKPDNTNVTIDKMVVNIKPDIGYILNIDNFQIQPYIGASMITINQYTKNSDGSYTITIPDDYANDNGVNLFINGHSEKIIVDSIVNISYIGNITGNKELKIKPDNDIILLVSTTDNYIFDNQPTVENKNPLDFSATWEEYTPKEITKNSDTQYKITFNFSDTDIKKEYRISGQTKTPEKPQPTPQFKVIGDDFTTYTINKNVINITVKNDYLIKSLKPYALLAVAGTKENLDDSTYSISSDEKTAAITVPVDYYDSLYTIYVNGNYEKIDPQPEPSGTGSINIYQFDDDSIKKFINETYLYLNGSQLASYDFTNFVNQVYRLPFTIPKDFSTGTTKVDTGVITLDIPARKISNETFKLDLGKIEISRENKNGFDFNVQSCSLYLPWISAIDLDFHEVINHTIYISYIVNMLDGRTTINIYSNDNLINSVQTTIQTQLELFNNYNNKSIGSLASTLKNELRQAYIQVNYYKPVDNLVSYETNEHGIIKDYKGYIQGINPQGLGSLDYTAQQNIKALLNGGIYIK